MALFTRTLSVILFFPLVLLAQSRDEVSSTESLSTDVKFRGFSSTSAQEDMPFMSEDWKISFFQLAATEPARFDDDKSTTFFFYNYFSFNYKLTEDSRIAIRPVFHLESPGVNKYDDTVAKWNMTWGDWYLQYSKFDMFDIGPFGTRLNLRWYAPTSEASQQNGMISKIHPEFFMETSFRRGTGIEIAFKGDYYFNSKKAYSFRTNSGEEILTTNKEAELESYIELNQRLNRDFNLKPRVTWYDEWKLASPANNRSSSKNTELAFGLGLDWHPTQNFNTTVIYSNRTRYYSSRTFRYGNKYVKREKYFDPDNNELVALTNYRF